MKVANLISKILTILFIALGAIFVILIMIKGDSTLKTDRAVSDKILNPFFVTAFVALGLGVAMVIAFPLIQMVRNPKSALRALVGIALLLIVAGIAYAVAAPDNISVEIADKFSISEAGSKRVGAALITTYIIGCLTVVSAIFVEINKLFK